MPQLSPLPWLVSFIMVVLPLMVFVLLDGFKESSFMPEGDIGVVGCVLSW